MVSRRPALRGGMMENISLCVPSCDRLLYCGLAASLLALWGCAVPKVPVPVGGSRADGVVRMAYEYGGLEVPQVDAYATKVSAAQRCAAWGYSDAEPFGGVMSQCEAANQYGCIRYLVTISYQCTGGGAVK